MTSHIFPGWTCSSLVLLVPIPLVTDFFWYKPVIILQGLTYVTVFLLSLFGSGVHFAQHCHGSRCGLFLLHLHVQPSYYQIVTSYVKGAIVLGYTVGAILAQQLVSLGGVLLIFFSFPIAIMSVSLTCITSLFLPISHTSLFLKEYFERQRNSGEDAQHYESQAFFT